MKGPRAARGALRLQDYGLEPGTPVVLHLRDPREKIWGFLLSTMAAGVVVRGMDLATFEDWLRQEVRGEDALLGASTLFYPMTRLERMEKDETVGPIPSYCERFRSEVGRTVEEALGLVKDEKGGSGDD
jgi:hypothetical protein